MASFDRKVERNQRRMNNKGKGSAYYNNQGNKNPRNSLGANGDGDVYKGRNIILPVALFVLAVLYGSVGLFGSAAKDNATIYWLTIVLYIILALVIFLKKPYLRVSKSWLYTTKFNRDKLLEASNISKIKFSRSKIVIVPKGKDVNWVFYRTRNRFDTEAMAARLELFANTFHVTLEKE